MEKQHPELILENVLIGVEDFYFPIESLTFGMEEDQRVSFIERPSIAKSQVWIDVEHREMTILVGKEKMKFDLHQRTPLTGEERRAFKKLEGSFHSLRSKHLKSFKRTLLKDINLKPTLSPPKSCI